MKHLLGIAVLVIGLATHAHAVSLRALPDLETVRFYEETFSTVATSYGPNDADITTRRADPLSAANVDFTFFNQEFYDVFYSDADGSFNLDGAFLTIEGVWRAGLAGLGFPAPGGMNINEVELVFGGPSPGSRFADFVASFEVGVGNVIPGSEALAVDHSLSTFPRFGQTSDTDLNDRFRLTVGFNGIPAVPVPSTLLLLVAGLGILAGRRLRGRS